jgi:hypothetical protein
MIRDSAASADGDGDGALLSAFSAKNTATAATPRHSQKTSAPLGISTSCVLPNAFESVSLSAHGEVERREHEQDVERLQPVTLLAHFQSPAPYDALGAIIAQI